MARSLASTQRQRVFGRNRLQFGYQSASRLVFQYFYSFSLFSLVRILSPFVPLRLNWRAFGKRGAVVCSVCASSTFQQRIQMYLNICGQTTVYQCEQQRDEVSSAISYDIFISLDAHECYFVLNVKQHKAMFNARSELTVDKISFIHFFICQFFAHISFGYFRSANKFIFRMYNWIALGSKIISAIFVLFFFSSLFNWRKTFENRLKITDEWLESLSNRFPTFAIYNNYLSMRIYQYSR